MSLGADYHHEYVDAENQAETVACPHGDVVHQHSGEKPEKDACGDDNLHPDGQTFCFAFFMNFPCLRHLADSHACAGDSGGNQFYCSYIHSVSNVLIFFALYGAVTRM